MSESIFCSVVIPVFNSEASLSELVDRTACFFEAKKISYEVILVNDGSRDQSWKLIKKMSQTRKPIVAIDLLRNYGQHKAMHCGFKHARGRYVITMDDDLQNPPEEIGKLIEKAGEGHDLVIGRYAVKYHSLFRRLGSSAVSFLNEKIFEKPRDLAMSNFRMVERGVIERVLGFPGVRPYIPGLLILYASRPVNAEVEHKSRSYGRSHYSFQKIMRVIFSILFSYSVYPLRALAAAGGAVAIFSFFLAGGFFIHGLMHQSKVMGWTSLAFMISFFSGFIILLLGVLGEYVIHITRTLNQPDSYHIREISRHG